MPWYAYLLIGLALAPVAWAAFILALCPRCPRCGSLRKGNWPTDEQGRFHHAALCGRCGHVWDWQES